MATAVPADAESSAVPACVFCEGRGLCYRSFTSLRGIPLTREQLEEVAAVYNAWRVGNLQDCTVKTTADIRL